MRHNVSGERLFLGILILVAGLLFVTSAGAKPAPTQGAINETDALARRVLEKFTERDLIGVVVVDFQPAFGLPDSFGRWLADNVSSSIGRQGKGVHLVDRTELTLSAQAQQSPEELSSARNAIALAKSVHAVTVILGSYGAIDNAIGISLAALRVSDADIASPEIGMIFGKIAVTPEVVAHLSVPLDSLQPKDRIYRSGYGGVSLPSCVRCPIPAMHVPDVNLQGMLRAHPKGATVWLQFVVTPEGKTQNVISLHPVGYGFDEQYAKAAADWELMPAVDPDNKPVSATYIFHIDFKFK
jgi:hypothetical protein